MPSDSGSIGDRLGRHIAATASTPLAPEVAAKAATCLLDGLALGIAAGAERTTAALLASPLLALGSEGCSVWPGGARAPLSEAVMLNGYAVHARFQDDTDMVAWAHPGSLVLPAAVCVAEATGATLEATLRGIVSGYSVLHWLGAREKVGAAVVARAFRASPTLGPVAAAAAAATVLGLDGSQAAHAAAIAAASAGGLIDTVGSGSSDWRFQNGSAAWRGVLGAILAQQGIDGSPSIFESPKGFVRAFAGIDAPDELREAPDPASILTVWSKPYPALGDNVAVISAALALRRRSPVDPAAITAVRVHQNAHFASYPGTAYRGPYTKATQGIASTPFGVAAALSRGAITYDLYGAGLKDPEILALVEKVAIAPEHDYGYLDGKVVVVTEDGEELACETSELPREVFFRDAPHAAAAFAATLAEVGVGGDAHGFAAGLMERVASGTRACPSPTSSPARWPSDRRRRERGAGVPGPRRALRGRIGAGRLVVAPGVFDGLSARVAEQAGFGVVYASGGAISRSTGVPDIGLMTMTEVLDRTRQIVDAVSVPVIADIDTGYGGNLNVARTVREFERIGVAGFHLEDQAITKRCGHYEGKTLVEPAVMVARLRAALEARTDPDLLVIARTDARADEGLDAAIERARAYAAAGADMLFVEAPQSEAEIETIASALDVPLLINMFAGGKTPLVGAARLQELGYALMIVPSDLQRAAIAAMQDAARTLLAEGSTASLADRMVTFADREELIGLEDYVALDDRYLAVEQGR
ncbi:hypothetical protein FSW04_10890 [Baekduia soli]|uniref:Isocitrate lyase/PEP mutase family protein n=1 Tax=Baekduia soli TaxID=496014 RepID=A0A5B8U4I9_9ACTN|nr:isocitrate lyase/phosphoenolpyruvate mutase family protein [Baekduia soli]QEC48026.1 hypothetical protein FSW04_10890 [Baekduia soli]